LAPLSNGRAAETQLRLRTRRALRAAALELRSGLARLESVRRAVLDRRDAVRDQLRDSQVRLGGEARDDDISALFRRGQMQMPLIPPPILARWVAGARERTELQVWANELVEATWPRNRSDDVPCTDPELLAAVGARQVEPLRRGVMSSIEVVTAARTTVAEWASHALERLKQPSTPKDEHGDPLATRGGECLVFAPMDARSELESVLPPDRFRSMWVDGPHARVIFIRTFGGYSLDEVLRGSGFQATDGTKS
jgi:hypothetical protein